MDTSVPSRGLFYLNIQKAILQDANQERFRPLTGTLLSKSGRDKHLLVINSFRPLTGTLLSK